MKKKPVPTSLTSVPAQPIVPAQLRELAKQSLETDKARPSKVCAVCESPYVPASGPLPVDDLCWVCRRLKISAWRENDQQLSAQE